MFAKRLLQKVTNLSPSSSSSQNAKLGSVVQTDLDPRIALHYGIPSTASVLAFDSIQRLMAIGTLDGRIKVVGGDNIEGLLISPKQLPYKNLEFLHNKGFLVSVTNDNVIQVWDLELRCIACSLQWGSNITAFSAIRGTYFMYVGDEWGSVSVLEYNAEDSKLLQLPYNIPAHSLSEAAGVTMTNHQSIVGVLPQPCASETRVLIVYEKGLIILWDVCEAQAVLIRGYKDLQPRDGILVSSPRGMNSEIQDDIADEEQEDKEISSLCWASSDGSIVAVGYIDGDIMLWNMSCDSSNKGQQSGVSSNNVVKLQLSSGERRLPVIVLHWSSRCRSDQSGGQLFIYGGDEIGSEEVLTVLTLEWSSGIETLQCVSRVDLTLDGTFSDLVLVPNAGEMNNPDDTLFVLTSPGQLHVYDDSILSALSSQKEKKPSVPAIQFPVLVPTVDPRMTVAKLSLIPTGGDSSKALVEIASVLSTGETPSLTTGSKWPLTGGVSSQLSSPEDNGIEQLYMAGYQDGSVRVWDATRPALSLMFVLEGKVEFIEVAGASASVSALDFCSLTVSLAIGNEYGLVRVYKLSGNSGEREIHFVIETEHKVNQIHQGKGFQCTAVFSFLSSPVRTLQFTNSGAKLAVGFECGRVGMLDMTSLSVLFLTESVCSSSSPVVSLTEKAFSDIHNRKDSPGYQEPTKAKDPVEVLIISSRDSHIVIVDSVTGDVISSRQIHQEKESAAIAMHIIESSNVVSETLKEKQLSQDIPTQDAPLQSDNLSGDAPQEITMHTSTETTTSGDSSLDSLVLLCSEDAVHSISLKSVLKGDYNSICKVNLAKPCCWSTTLKRKDEKACGLALLYQTGVVEIRSLPDLEVVYESSLRSILRWNFKANMERTICSSGYGQISLVNGCELAFISLMASENDFRISESLPSLHDKVLAAAADAAINYSANQNKKQGTSPGVLGGIIKGIKGEKLKSVVDLTGSLSKSNLTQHLEIIFSKAPFSDPSDAIKDNKEVVELSIDDIEIDEPIRVTSTASHQGKADGRGKEAEREKLFQGATADTKPRLRNAEEIKAKYRKTGDASAVASQARDKLVQRQEKLERLSRRTEELQDGAQNFASMANDLVKTMEGRKWWKI